MSTTRPSAIVTMALAAMLGGAMLWSSAATAQTPPPSSVCSDDCKAAYGACYKSTLNRDACSAKLSRCLQACGRRSSAEPISRPAVPGALAETPPAR